MADVYLRPLTVEDAATSYKWRNDADLWKYTGRRPDIVVTEEIERAWAARVIADSTRANYAICTNGGQYIGNVYLVNIHDGLGELGIFIGNRSCHGLGYGSQALAALKGIAKEEIGLKAILIDVAEANISALRIYEKCGAVRCSDRQPSAEGRFWMQIYLNNRRTLGERLRIELGPEEMSERYLKNSDSLMLVIDDVIDALKNKARTKMYSLDIKDAFIVSCLYCRPYHNSPPEYVDYVRSTIVCIIRYLEWCKLQLPGGKLERRWLRDFYYDLYQTGILPEMYGNAACYRCYTNNTLMQYGDIYALLRGAWTPQPNVRDMLSLFGLRQVLEAKFRRLLGLRWVEPMPKIPHEVLPRIIKCHADQIRITTAETMDWDSVMHIYNWTDYSIHTMSTNRVWLVWFAVDWCKRIFIPPKKDLKDKRKYFHINGAIELTEVSLDGLREDFRKWLSENACPKAPDKKVRVIWDPPEAPVVDRQGNLMQLKVVEEDVFITAQVKERRKASVMFGVFEWPSDDCKLIKNLKALRSAGISLTIVVGTPLQRSGYEIIPDLDIHWYCVQASCEGGNHELARVLKEREITQIVSSCDDDSLIRYLVDVVSSCEEERVRQVQIKICKGLEAEMSQEEVDKICSSLEEEANDIPSLTRFLGV